MILDKIVHKRAHKIHVHSAHAHDSLRVTVRYTSPPTQNIPTTKQRTTSLEKYRSYSSTATAPGTKGPCICQPHRSECRPHTIACLARAPSDARIVAFDTLISASGMSASDVSASSTGLPGAPELTTAAERGPPFQSLAAIAPPVQVSVWGRWQGKRRGAKGQPHEHVIQKRLKSC